MKKPFIFLSLYLILSTQYSLAQKKPADTLFLMNGRIVAASIIDTLFGAATFVDPDDSTKRAHVENDQLFAIKYNNGDVFYYYEQDSASGNWFTRDEMWYFTKGERDARKGFKPHGSLWGTMACGIVGGITGTLFAPIAPIVYTSMVGLPWVRIKHNTVSNINDLNYDSYILGYEREARAKRRIYSLIGGGIGLLLGYTTYFVWLKHEPNYLFH